MPDQDKKPDPVGPSGPRVVDDTTETIVPPQAPPEPEPELEEQPGGDEPQGGVHEDEEVQEPELSPHEKRMAELRAELEDDDEPAAGGEQEELEEPEEEAELGDQEEELEEELDYGDLAIAEDDEGRLFMELPNRQPDGDPHRVPVTQDALEAAGLTPAEARERLNQLHNGYGRRKALRDERRAFEEERNAFFEELDADPAGFLANEIDGEIRKDVVKALLRELDDEAYTEVLQTADELSDSDARKRARDEAELERRRKADEREEKRSEGKDPEVQAIQDAILELVPEDMDDLDAHDFVTMAGRRLKTHAVRHKLKELDPAEIPDLLADLGVLDAFDLAGGAGEGSNGAGKPARSSAPKGTEAKGKKAPDTRSRLKRRQDSSRTTPAGAGGAAAQGFQPVKGETYLERRNRVAKKLGLPTKDAV